MSKDTRDKVLTEQARQMATKMLRSPALAVSYRDALVDAVEDSSFDEKLTEWYAEAGFATNHAHVASVLADAPRSLLAYWDGLYLIRADDELHALKIGATGVLIDGVATSDPVLQDGVLKIFPSASAPYQAELSFTEVGWHGEGSIGADTVFERACTGRFWKKDAERPKADNVVGASRRLTLDATTPATKRAASAARVGDVDPTLANFAKDHGGEYEAHWTRTPHADAVVRHLFVATKDDAVTARFDEEGSTEVTLAKSNLVTSRHLTYSDDKLTFDLVFDTFGQVAQSFDGSIFTKGGERPVADNVHAIWTRQPSRFTSDVIFGIAVGAFGIVAAILTPIISSYAGKKDADEIKSRLDDVSKIDRGPLALFSKDPYRQELAMEDLKSDSVSAKEAFERLDAERDAAFDQLNKEAEALQRTYDQLARQITEAKSKGDLAKADALRQQQEATAKDQAANKQRQDKNKDQGLIIKDEDSENDQELDDLKKEIEKKKG